MGTTNLIVVLLILISLLYLLIIGTILQRRNFKEGIVGLLIVYVVFSLVWTIEQQLNFFFLAPVELLTHITLYGLLFLTLIFFHLNCVFVQLTGKSWPWWILGITWIAGVIVLNENLVTAANLGGILPQQASMGAALSGWFLAMGGAILITGRAYRQTQQPLHKNRLQYWILALLFTLGSGVLFFVNYLTLSSGFHLIGALIITYVILTHNLIDIRRMVRQTVSYFIITLLTVTIYTGGFLGVQYMFQSLPNYNPIWAGATIAVILSILFNPLLTVIQGFVRRFITGDSYDASHIVREYSANINNILDLDELATVTLTHIGRAIGIRRGILFLIHASDEAEEGDVLNEDSAFYLRGIFGTGEGLPTGSKLPSGIISTTGPIGKYLSQEEHPLTQYDIDMLPRFQEANSDERDWLRNLNMVVHVPIHVKKQWIGLFTFGPKLSGDRYFDSDLTLLRTLGDQTAIALENARLFDNLKVYAIKIEHLNIELAEANRKLTRLEQAKTDFIGVASHELRTPLTQVRGFNDILSDMAETGDLTPESAIQMTKGIRKSASRLQTIVDTMFDMSQIDTETLDLNASPNSLASIINMIADELAPALKERKQTLTTANLNDLPMITADGQRIKQIFSNLIGNAVKYTPDGKEISVIGRLLDRHQPPPEQSIEIVIRDTGIGIDAQDLERLFEKFYRVGDVALHSTGATKFKGAGPGLGLTVARGLIEAHGGRIWAESPGYDEKTCPGSSFYVVLPVEPGRLRMIEAEQPRITQGLEPVKK